MLQNGSPPRRLRITAGMGSADDYPCLCAAGADEVFTGFVPEDWQRRYGLALPINRRESRYANVQLGGDNDLARLAALRRESGTPVTLAFNSLFYIPRQIPELLTIMRRCAALGFDRFIVADPALLFAMHRAGLTESCSVHISGEMGTMNRETARLCRELGARRIIFHRKTSLADMAAIIRAAPGMEYEAFALNENCHFHGAFCHTLHCDELPHMCRVPYRAVTDGTVQAAKAVSGLSAAETRSLQGDDEPPPPGATGCGLCALWRMARLGVTDLKLVGRGNWVDAAARDIRVMREAADLAARDVSEAAYIRRMKERLFPSGCGGQCYYFDQTV